MGTEYDLVDSTREHGAVQRRFAAKLLDKLRDRVPPGSRVLEIGPGVGHFAEACTDAGLEYCAVEGSRVLLRPLRERGFDVVPGMVPPIPRPDNSADLVYAGMVLEHMRSPSEATEFVAEIFRVLAPGGRMVLLFPNAQACGRVFWDMDYTHGYFTTPRRVRQMCSQLCFANTNYVRTIGWFWVRSTPLTGLARFLSNTLMSGLNTHFVETLASLVRLENILWRFRKTLFEATLLEATKPSAPVRAPDPARAARPSISESSER